MQTHIYYQTYEDDSVWMKGYVRCIDLASLSPAQLFSFRQVAFIMALTTLSSIFLIHGMYYYVVTNYGNPVSLRHDIWYVVSMLKVILRVADGVRRSFIVSLRPKTGV